MQVVTRPRVFKRPSPIEDAMESASQLKDLKHCVHLSPGPRHWTILDRLRRDSEAKGDLIPDALLAALAIEAGSEWITLDGDFARFRGLRWRRPRPCLR